MPNFGQSVKFLEKLPVILALRYLLLLSVTEFTINGGFLEDNYLGSAFHNYDSYTVVLFFFNKSSIC